MANFFRQGARLHYGAVILALLLWSTSFIGTKIAYQTFGPITLGASRFVLATGALGLLLLAKRQFILPAKEHLGWIALSGILGITLYFTMENIGVSMTSASNATLIVASYPAVTSLLEFLVYKQPLSRTKLAGIAVAVAGVYLLSGVDNAGAGGNGNPVLGNLILIATGIVWAFYNFTTRKAVNHYPGAVFSFYQTLAGTLLFLPLALLERASWQPPTPKTLGVLVYLGIFCSVAAFLLYNFGLRKLSAGTAVSMMNLVPLFGVLFSVLLLGEAVTARQLVGGAVVMAGVLLSARQGKPAPKPVPSKEPA